MSNYTGRFITRNATLPTSSAAQGIWTVKDVAYWTRSGQWPSALGPSDPYWSYVTYLLSTTAINTAQNNTFIDSSPNNFTITRVGNTTQGSFTPYGTLWSNYFDGSDALTSTSAISLALGSGNFTIEWWQNLSNATRVAGNLTGPWAANNWTAGCDSGTTFVFYVYNYNTGTPMLTGTIAYNTWQHIAITRSGNTWRMYINGVLQSTITSSAALDGGSSHRAVIGSSGYTAGGAGEYATGYISNYRIVKDVALYTSAFTPPAAPLSVISGTSILTCQSNRFRDASNNNFALTKVGDTSVTAFSPFNNLLTSGYSTSVNGGSGYFDGSDYLTVPANATAFGLGSSNFTLECWVYETDISYNVGYMGCWSTSYILYREGPTYRFYYFGPTGSPLTPSISAVANTWTHLAIVRNGSTLTFYVNGVVGATANVGTSAFNNPSNPFYIGANQDNPSVTSMKGYMAGARLVKGTAVYTAAFTPPTVPPTALEGTSLMCNFTNANLFDATMDNNIETIGNARVSTLIPKFGDSSAYFDGSGDVITSPPGPQFNFGTGDFTVEFWMYKTSSTAYQRIISYGAFTQSGNLQIEAADDLTLTVHVNGGFLSTSVPNLLNTWVHVAVTRASGSVRVFTDGVLRSTNSQAGSIGGVNVPFAVGAIHDASNPFTGYIDEVRVTRGFARYTSTFTPPTLEYPRR